MPQFQSQYIIFSVTNMVENAGTQQSRKNAQLLNKNSQIFNKFRRWYL